MIDPETARLIVQQEKRQQQLVNAIFEALAMFFMTEDVPKCKVVPIMEKVMVLVKEATTCKDQECKKEECE